MSIVKIESKAQFAELIVNSKGYVFVDFSASWCMPCKIIYPKLEEYSKKYPLIKFLYVDIDKNKELSEIYNITSVPSFLVFKPDFFIPEYDPIQGGDVSKIDNFLNLLTQNINLTNNNNK